MTTIVSPLRTVDKNDLKKKVFLIVKIFYDKGISTMHLTDYQPMPRFVTAREAALHAEAIERRFNDLENRLTENTKYMRDVESRHKNWLGSNTRYVTDLFNKITNFQKESENNMDVINKRVLTVEETVKQLWAHFEQRMIVVKYFIDQLMGRFGMSLFQNVQQQKLADQV